MGKFPVSPVPSSRRLQKHNTTTNTTVIQITTEEKCFFYKTKHFSIISIKKTAFLASNDYDHHARHHQDSFRNQQSTNTRFLHPKFSLSLIKKTTYSCIIAVPNDLNADSWCHLMILSSYKRENTAFKSMNTTLLKENNVSKCVFY